MSTRANIKFEDQHDTFFVDRSHDGFPTVVLIDIQETLLICKHRWSGSELGQLVSYFLGMHFDISKRIQSYELTSSIAGDESFCYYVKWDNKTGTYLFGVEK